MNNIKSTHQIAYNYVQALKTQRTYDNNMDVAMRLLNPDNQVFGLADAIEGPYTKLVAELVGPELFDWITWWMWETEFGTLNMEFIIHGTSYDPTTMTLFKFLELVDDK